ncbi:MAG: phenylalanine--tRNA ligase subunit beta [Peptoniphilus lacydonensis]|uniref:phenylalanine--tRNA ligase subunit beta n=2 Tax=Peptoniphilus lacydonensis TaxID=1673725 RepID=UPI0028FDC8E5|nr:phenylalanine--tRNA ligase subunit beta [Peptoniphilus lacydonensis]MDU2115748.1 phenylalanine--tRNA ligase subunit beta [Peptoniphilus lacydonensis]
MLLPIKWLKDYVDFDFDVKKLADGLSNSGSHVESIIIPDDGLNKIVVGKIEKIEKHPDADKLVICSVNVGDEILQIVTGASNVFEGAIVPVALHGSTLAGDVKIKKGKLRGVESNGMLCSLEELGFENSVIPKEAKNGIFIFPEGTEIGKSAIEVLFMDNEILELEITPNRPDCLSIMGMAVETAASFDLKTKHNDIKIENEVSNFSEFFDDIIVETENCNRYYSKILKNIKIGPSPLWLQAYLMQAGVRPVSNIVDLTNFVMLEYGEPLHAFDLDTLKNKKIVVRMAKDGEEMVTLDGETRKLEKDDILITDGSEIVGLAGVMGGLDSEITDKTVNVLLEGASFNKENIRKTSRRLNLRSEASSRFEKGIDVNLAKIAVDRVCELAEKMGIAEVVDGNKDVGNFDRKEKEIKLRKEKVNNLIGVDFTMDEISNILNRLEIETDLRDDYLIAKVPTVRLDLDIEEDLIEEIARIYGYDNIEPKKLKGTLTVGRKPVFRNVEDRIKNQLIGLGYSEFMTYSFVSPSSYEKANYKEDEKNIIKILNPLGEDYSIMRTTMIPSMIDALSKNYARGNVNVGGFEIGNTFFPTEEELPSERLKLAMGFYDLGDFYYLKESIEKSLWYLGINNLEVRRRETSFLHPGRSAEFILNGKSLGVFGEVHPKVLENYGLKKRAYVAELDFNLIVENTIDNYTYKALPKYPTMKRDFAFVMDRDVDSVELEKISKKYGKELLESFKVFDIYEGKNIEDGKKSVAFSLVFRAADRTLEESEVTEICEKIVAEIESEIEAKLRS